MTSPRDRLRIVLQHLDALEPLAPRSVADARDALTALGIVCEACACAVHYDGDRDPTPCDYAGVPTKRGAA